MLFRSQGDISLGHRTHSLRFKNSLPSCESWGVTLSICHPGLPLVRAKINILPLLPSSLPLNPPQRPQASSPSPTTTGGHREPPLFVVESPHKEEHFNRSRIFKTYLKDSVENKASNLTFAVFLEVTMILSLLLVILSLSLHLF